MAFNGRLTGLKVEQPILDGCPSKDSVRLSALAKHIHYSDSLRSRQYLCLHSSKKEMPPLRLELRFYASQERRLVHLDDGGTSIRNLTTLNAVKTPDYLKTC